MHTNGWVRITTKLYHYSMLFFTVRCVALGRWTSIHRAIVIEYWMRWLAKHTHQSHSNISGVGKTDAVRLFDEIKYANLWMHHCISRGCLLCAHPFILRLFPGSSPVARNNTQQKVIRIIYGAAVVMRFAIIFFLFIQFQCIFFNVSYIHLLTSFIHIVCVCLWFFYLFWAPSRWQATRMKWPLYIHETLSEWPLLWCNLLKILILNVETCHIWFSVFIISVKCSRWNFMAFFFL